MRHHRRPNHLDDRVARFARDYTSAADFVREAGIRTRLFITERPILSTCLGLATGYAVGSLIRRRSR